MVESDVGGAGAEHRMADRLFSDVVGIAVETEARIHPVRRDGFGPLSGGD